jgi:probable HAF family extracellular repeat protein
MKKMRLKHSLLICSILLACAGQATAASYSLTTFSPTSDGVAAEAHGINNAGVVSGTIYHGPFSIASSAVTWSGGSTTYLDMAGGVFSTTAKINNQGTVIGSIASIVHDDDMGDMPLFKPAIWNNGVATTLPALGDERFGNIAIGLNNAGVVVGLSGVGPYGTTHAVKWVDGAAIDLGTAGADDSLASAINDNGQIVGRAATTTNHISAILWQNGAAIDLGAQAGIVTNTWATDINNAGLVVGAQSSATGFNTYATIWDNGVATQLGSFGYGSSGATAINNAGDVVGQARAADGTDHGVLWSNGGMTDLNNYLDASLRADGWILSSAADINDRGDIVGVISKADTGEARGFLLAVSAVPEPSTYAMMLSGFGLLAFAARRRKGPQP